MRLIVMFDLPVETSKEKREYRKFKEGLLQEGFVMIQYSVYSRVCVNKAAANNLEKRLLKVLPSNGLVQTFMMTEKQYNDMHFLVGEKVDDLRNSAERTIII